MALAVNLQPVPLHLELVLGGLLRQGTLDVTADQVLGQATLGAYQVVVVASVAQLVVKASVFHQHPAQYASVHQQVEAPVYGGPTHLGQTPPGDPRR